ncbi:NUDIX hydrolase [Nocardiopsis tropica]|uniref:NUDIX domain-containing protein n=1 Tax=Nocardiopsis tropica TaxID=109330 RepID=A0ABU7KKZ9_9ACTN|nr:NUDIX domain-containing protein [Nocardiopsis umidischolae]MEE2049963.1 NUDIX domain-containing protein [Nocardiopsis umidischolae]
MRLGALPGAHDSVVCLTYDGDRPLLVRHRDRGWEFPGGHSEPGETVEDTARREAREEAGATLGEVGVVGHYVLASGHVTVVTHARVTGLEPLSGDFETVGVRSFDVLPADRELSWADGVYAHLLRELGLPGAPVAQPPTALE